MEHSCAGAGLTAPVADLVSSRWLGGTTRISRISGRAPFVRATDVSAAGPTGIAVLSCAS